MTTKPADGICEIERFEQQKRDMIRALGQEVKLHEFGRRFLHETCKFRYTYHFTWLGRPIIQLPQDIIAIQELIWSVQPRVVIETGVAHGGGLVLNASILELLGGDREVIGIDIDIRAHNRTEIERHPLTRRIHMIQGSSTDPNVVRQVRDRVAERGPVLVILDSDHTHAHVLRELELYAPFVQSGSYIVVMDTTVEFLPNGFCADRVWGKGNSPMSAVHAFLKSNDRFVIDASIHNKLLITVAYDGYLKCVKD